MDVVFQPGAVTTAYVYDPLFLEHDLPGHPENRARLDSIMATLKEEGLLDRMRKVPSQPVEETLLARVHDAAYIQTVERISAHGGGFLDPDTYVGRRSFQAASVAAGSVATLVRWVGSGTAQNGVALVRPPGHHATRSRGMGFCLFNNIAVGAYAALELRGIIRVLIVDWDVHHGNGTQDIFYGSPQVFFFSTHQSPHYPGTGDWRETGVGDGSGYTCNVPLLAGVGDHGIARVFSEVLEPLARRFAPDIILVSAGYDAHWNDPLAGLHLSLRGYWQMVQVVLALAQRLCNGRLVLTLEGGYDLGVLSRAIADTCRAFLGDDAPGIDPLGPCPWDERPLGGVLQALKRVHGLDETS